MDRKSISGWPTEDGEPIIEMSSFCYRLTLFAWHSGVLYLTDAHLIWKPMIDLWPAQRWKVERDSIVGTGVGNWLGDHIVRVVTRQETKRFKFSYLFTPRKVAEGWAMRIHEWANISE